MIRTIAAMFVGFATAMFLMTLVGSVGLKVYPMPEGLMMDDAEGMATYFATIPLGAILFSMASWMLGALGGSLGACSMAKENAAFFTVVVGGGVLLIVSKALRKFDYPDWFNIVSVVGILCMMVLAVLLAKRLGFDNPTQTPDSFKTDG